MKQFVCGILYATGVALFGKGMYELGKHHECKENQKRWQKFGDDMLEIMRKSNEKKEEKGEE